MNNHFGKGLMAGLHAPYAYSAHHAVNSVLSINVALYWVLHTVCSKRPAIVNLARGRPEF